MTDDSPQRGSIDHPGGAWLLAISVGNTRTQLGLFAGDSLERSERFANTDFEPIVQTLAKWLAEAASQRTTAVEPKDSDPENNAAASVLLTTVNQALSDQLAKAIETTLGVEVFRVGDDVPIPIGLQLDPETITGADRLLNAAAAFDRLKQACVIVDAGTAITVDFVDGQGTFHGGAIAPGAAMQLRALHDHTASLPEVPFRTPDAEAFGRNTTQAMLQGVYHGIRGMVRTLVERYAEAYGAYPMVVATGGDAPALFSDDELIDRIVPELTLLGVAIAARHALSDDQESPTQPPGDSAP